MALFYGLFFLKNEKITVYEQEPAELILSMGFFLFVLVNKFRQIKEFKKTE